MNPKVLQLVSMCSWRQLGYILSSPSRPTAQSDQKWQDSTNLSYTEHTLLYNNLTIWPHRVVFHLFSCQSKSMCSIFITRCVFGILRYLINTPCFIAQHCFLFGTCPELIWFLLFFHICTCKRKQMLLKRIFERGRNEIHVSKKRENVTSFTF